MGALTAGRVLLAEDDADLRRLLALTLRRAGYAVLEAGDGPGALALARGARPDVAVLDGRLPGLSGPAVAAALAADPATAGVAVVLASGAPPPAAPAGGPPALPGVVAYLEKPFARAALLARVAQARAAAGAAERRRTRGRASRAPRSGAGPGGRAGTAAAPPAPLCQYGGETREVREIESRAEKEPRP